MICIGTKVLGKMVLNLTPEEPVSDMDYMYFQAVEKGASVSLTAPYTIDVEFDISTDGTNWNTWSYDLVETDKVFSTIQLSGCGDYVFIRASSTNNWAATETSFMQFHLDGGKTRCGGNIMSLFSSTLSVETLENNYSFKSLFQDCTTLVSAPSLPSTSLSS